MQDQHLTRGAIHPSYVTIAKRLGLTGKDDAEFCQALIKRIDTLIAKVGNPKSFSDFGISEAEYMGKLDYFAQLAAPAMATKLAPRIPTIEETKELLEAAYYSY